jgi:hypothetical protein
VNKALEDGEIDKSKLIDLRTTKCLYHKELNQYVRPQDCFSEEHPFGTHRVRLGADDLTVLKELLTTLGIRARPTWEDAVEVLREISQSDDALLKRKISSDEKRVVIACWKLLESALNDEDQDTTAVCNKIAKLAELPVVCRADNLMDLPSKVFFRDREHLAEAFAGRLNAELIRMPQGATDALTRAGVRRLSEVTGIHITHDEADQREAQLVASRIQERVELLVNVVEACRSARQKPSLPDLRKLRVFETNTLTVELTFNGFSRPLPPVRDSVVAVIEKSPETLWYRLDDGLPPWDAIACELARLCLDSDDVAQLAAAVNAAIEPESLRRAQRKLSQLGFPSIELSHDSPGATEAAPAFGIQGVQSSAEFRHEESSDSVAVFTESAAGPVTALTNEGKLASRSSTTSSAPCPAVTNEKVGERQQPSSHRCQETTIDNHPQTEQQKWPAKSVPMSDEQPFIDWLVGQSGATDRRKQKILEASSEADRRRSEYRQRKQRVNQIPKEEVLLYLRNFYSRNNRLRCQMMAEGDSDLHEMPFWKSSEQMYAGKEELFNRQMAQLLPHALPETNELNLFLCPNCAAIYTKFIASRPEQQMRLFDWLRSGTYETTFSIDCSLSGKQPNRIIHFHPKHLDDIRSVDGVFDASAAELEG